MNKPPKCNEYEIMGEINHVPIRSRKKVLDNGNKHIFVHMAFSDMQLHLMNEEEKKEGYLSMGIGGTIIFKMGNKEFFINPYDLWNAACKSFNKEELMIKE